MRTVFSTVAVFALWCAAGWRLQLRRPSLGERYLSAALLGLAVTLTLDHPAITRGLQQLTGMPNLTDLFKHLIVLLAAWASVESVRLHLHDEVVARRGRKARLITATVCSAVLIALFAVAKVAQLTPSPLMDATATSGYLQAYWAVYIAYLVVALVGIARSMALLARYTEPSPVRVTFVLVAVGAGMAVMYLIHKGAVLTLDTADADGGWLRATRDPLSEVLVLGAVVPFVVGITWQVLVRLPLVRHAAAYRALTALYPLWKRLYEATPEVALTPPSTDSQCSDSRPGPRDVEHCLQRRIIEIRDGALALRPYISVSTPEAQSAAIRHRVRQRDTTIIAEAAQLEVARRAKRRAQLSKEETHLTSTGASDLAGETRTLRRVARHLSVVDLIADDLDTNRRLDAL